MEWKEDRVGHLWTRHRSLPSCSTPLAPKCGDGQYKPSLPNVRYPPSYHDGLVLEQGEVQKGVFTTCIEDSPALKQ